MGEALSLVKRGLGGRAVILFTRTVRGKGFFGLLGRQVVEIGAVRDGDVHSMRESTAGESRTAGGTSQPVSFQKVGRRLQHAYGVSQTPGPATLQVRSDDISQIRRELTIVRSSVENAIRQSCAIDVSQLPAPLVDIYLGLVRNELSRHIAVRVVKETVAEIPIHPENRERIPEPLTLRELVTRRLAQLMTVSGPVNVLPTGGPRVIALVGPTGVGKTTTVAKLAGDFGICKGKKVGLVTIDTYRIAAVQQLQTIADIVRVPLKTVLTIGELRAALSAFHDRDVVIIDTAGRTQRDELKMNELASFMQAVGPDEIHLVLAATARQRNLQEVLDRFKQVGVNRLVLSKLDEAEGIGSAFGVAAESGLPVSYVTNGQDIPDDIAPADSDGLARMMTSQIWVPDGQAGPSCPEGTT